MKTLTHYQISKTETLFGHKWEIAKNKANAIVVTGMEEHSERYADFAKFLNNHGINVYTMDYYGQGENVNQGATLGEVPINAFEKFTLALGTLAVKLKATGKPLYILGHSMGSFLTQRTLQKYGKYFDKAVIIGSNGPSALFGLGKLVAKLTVTKRNHTKTSKLLASMSVGSYAKSVKNAKTPLDWLSYNEENVAKYIANPLDGGPSSKGFYLELLKGTAALYNESTYERLRRDIPLLIIAGKDDPVGEYGKGIEKLVAFYNKLAFTHVESKIYENMRHEILNENDKAVVYKDIINFLK